ncbi:hypothetical protein PG996_005306 [Apiospora saccharicola]|uniref:Uncharacterized protein n=1 Tax=Apiospora saccharicola TaxID=335842 RepID=A0ABR1VQ39_9PEZI
MDAPQAYPSFELLRAQRQPPKLSMDMLRIRWQPFGPLEESIQVADNARSHRCLRMTSTTGRMTGWTSIPPHADDDEDGTSTWVAGSGDDEDDEDGLGRKLVRCHHAAIKAARAHRLLSSSGHPPNPT